MRSAEKPLGEVAVKERPASLACFRILMAAEGGGGDGVGRSGVLNLFSSLSLSLPDSFLSLYMYILCIVFTTVCSRSHRTR